jgi:hypothetical protein
MSESLLVTHPDFHWTPAPAGFALTLIAMHGDADAFTTHTARFPLSADGRRDVLRLVAVMDYLYEGVARFREGCLEDLCVWLAQRTGEAPEWLVEQLEPLIRSDCRYEDMMATPAAYTLTETDATGRTLRASFPDGPNGPLCGYMRLSSTHRTWLTPWA